MSPRERELEAQVRQARSQVLDLRLQVHSLEVENGELKRRIRVQSIEMEKVKASAYEAYMSTMAVMGQRFGLE